MFHGTSNELSSGCWVGFSNIPEGRTTGFSTSDDWAAEVEEERRRTAESETPISIPAERRLDLRGIPGHFFDFHRDANHGSGILCFFKSNIQNVEDPFSERVSSIQTVTLNSTRALSRNVIYVYDLIDPAAVDVQFRHDSVATDEIFFMPNISPESYDESHSDPVIGAHLYGMEITRITDARSFVRYIKTITPNSPFQEELSITELNLALHDLERVDSTPVIDLLPESAQRLLADLPRPSNIKTLIISGFMIRGINNIDSVYPMGYRLLMHSFFDLFSKFIWNDDPHTDYDTVAEFITWVMLGSCDTCWLKRLLNVDGDYAIYPYSTSTYNIGSRCLSFDGFPKAMIQFLAHGSELPKVNQLRAPHTTHALWFPDASVPYGKFTYSPDQRIQRPFEVPMGPAFNLYQLHRRLWASYKKSLVTKDPYEFSKVIQSYYADDAMLDAYVDMISQLISSTKWTSAAVRWVQNLTTLFYIGYIPSSFNVLHPIGTQYSEFVSNLCHINNYSYQLIFEALQGLDSRGRLHSHLTSESRRQYVATLLPDIGDPEEI